MSLLRSLLLLALLLAALPSAAQSPSGDEALTAFAGSLTAVPAEPLGTKGAVYVPAYSTLRAVSGRTKLDFAITLSIQNASEDKPLVLERVDYFDTTGKLVEKFLRRPVALKPYATLEIFIAKDDVRGGTGANFVVHWAGAGPIAEPVIESVMISSHGNTSYSFVSQGRPVRTVGAP